MNMADIDMLIVVGDVTKTEQLALALAARSQATKMGIRAVIAVHVNGEFVKVEM